MRQFFNILDKFISNPTSLNLSFINNFLKFGIPFNAPHGFKIKKLSHEEVIISLPNKKLNHNHLGGIHACAMATVGEYCAGMSLLKIFGISKYRLILSELNVKYTYQGRVELEGICLPTQIDNEKVKKGLEVEGKFFQELKTVIREVNGQEVAVVTTLWQLKDWEQVKTK
jgi:acyl-coenzyme A thioesterase PaaI-like protein